MTITAQGNTVPWVESGSFHIPPPIMRTVKWFVGSKTPHALSIPLSDVVREVGIRGIGLPNLNLEYGCFLTHVM